MIRDLDRSREIAQMLIRPEPARPSVTVVKWSRSSGPNHRFPLNFHFGELNVLLQQQIAKHLQDEVEAFGIDPDFIIGSVPFGRRFSQPLAYILNKPNTGYDTTDNRFEDALFLSKRTSSACVFVDDYLSGGGKSVIAIERLKSEYDISGPLYVSVVTYDTAQGEERIKDLGAEVRSLTTVSEIMQNRDFLGIPINRINMDKRNRYQANRDNP